MCHIKYGQRGMIMGFVLAPMTSLYFTYLNMHLSLKCFSLTTHALSFGFKCHLNILLYLSWVCGCMSVESIHTPITSSPRMSSLMEMGHCGRIYYTLDDYGWVHFVRLEATKLVHCDALPRLAENLTATPNKNDFFATRARTITAPLHDITSITRYIKWNLKTTMTNTASCTTIKLQCFHMANNTYTSLSAKKIEVCIHHMDE